MKNGILGLFQERVIVYWTVVVQNIYSLYLQIISNKVIYKHFFRLQLVI